MENVNEIMEKLIEAITKNYNEENESNVKLDPEDMQDLKEHIECEIWDQLEVNNYEGEE